MEVVLSKLYPEVNIATGYLLAPGETILCSSNEYIVVPKDVYAIVASRFSYAQLGLSIELGTSIIQAGHKGAIHFQIQNNTSNYIYIYPNISVAQLLFYRTIQPSSRSYHELHETHNYDEASSPPLSKFREKNDILDSVAIPKRTVARVFMDVLRQKLSDSLIGLFFTIVLIAIGMTAFPAQLTSFLSCILKAFTTMFDPINSIWQCVGVAFIIEIIRVLLIVVGRGVVLLHNKIIYSIRKNS